MNHTATKGKAAVAQFFICLLGLLGMLYFFSNVLSIKSSKPVAFADLRVMEQPDQKVKFAGFQPLVDVITANRNGRNFDCQPVTASSDGDIVLLMNRFSDKGNLLGQLIKRGYFIGFANHRDREYLGEELCTELSQRYPEFDLDSATTIELTLPTPALATWAWCAAVFFLFLGIAALPFKLLNANKACKEEHQQWRATIPEDRSSFYQEHNDMNKVSSRF